MIYFNNVIPNDINMINIEFNSFDLFKEICHLKSLSYSDKFFYDNKIFLDNYKKQSSILNFLGSI